VGEEDATIIADDHGVVVSLNGAAEAMLGWTSAEIVGRTLADTVVPDQYRNAHERGLARYRRTGRMTIIDRSLEVFARHRDGRLLAVTLVITRLQRRPDLFGARILSGWRQP
jgi:PAS domain S-box-containing protein